MPAGSCVRLTFDECLHGGPQFAIDRNQRLQVHLGQGVRVTDRCQQVREGSGVRETRCGRTFTLRLNSSHTVSVAGQ
jgi:hypothetical protein